MKLIIKDSAVQDTDKAEGLSIIKCMRDQEVDIYKLMPLEDYLSPIAHIVIGSHELKDKFSKKRIFRERASLIMSVILLSLHQVLTFKMINSPNLDIKMLIIITLFLFVPGVILLIISEINSATSVFKKMQKNSPEIDKKDIVNVYEAVKRDGKMMIYDFELDPNKMVVNEDLKKKSRYLLYELDDKLFDEDSYESYILESYNSIDTNPE